MTDFDQINTGNGQVQGVALAGTAHLPERYHCGPLLTNEGRGPDHLWMFSGAQATAENCTIS